MRPNETTPLLPAIPQTCVDRIPAPIRKIFSEIFSEAVFIPGFLNWVRDFVWTFFSYDLLNARLHQTENATFDAKGQWFSQQLYSTLTMLAALFAMFAVYKIKKLKFPWAHAFIYLTAASIAIYGWDRMQVVGINVGQQQLKLSANDAAYFAAPFTGLEGFMQFFVIVLLRTLTLDEYYTPFKQEPKKFLKQLAAGTACSLTLVALPGANWQIFFALGSLNKWGAIATSFAVAFTVAFWNYTSVKMSSLLLNCLYQYNANQNESDRIETISNETKSGDDNAARLVIDVSDSTIDRTSSNTEALPKSSKWNMVRSATSQKKIVADHLPASTNPNEETEQSPLTKMNRSARNLGSGIFQAGNGALERAASSFKKRSENKPAVPPTIDPAFGSLVAETSFTT